MKHLDELVLGLVNDRKGIISGELPPKVAKELTNNAGKIINANKLQLEYKIMKERKPKIKIKFLEDSETVS